MGKSLDGEIEKQSDETSFEHLDATDTIRIRRIRVLGKHGVTERERSVLRPLIVDIEITANLSAAQQSDDINDTVNYSSVHKSVMHIIETRSHKLLESLAGKIIATLFEDKRILSARVRISKPERLDGATPSVTLARKNSGQ